MSKEIDKNKNESNSKKTSYKGEVIFEFEVRKNTKEVVVYKVGDTYETDSKKILEYLKNKNYIK